MRTKRFLASLIALLMLFTLLPAAALAEEPIPEETEAVSPPSQPKTLNYGYYLIGRFGWTVDDLVEYRDKFQQNYSASTEEYKLTTTLEEGQQIKVVLVSNGTQLGPWFPDGDFNYTVDAAHAGTKIIYFRPNYNSDWAEFGGYMFITDPPVFHIYFNQPAHGYLSADKTEAAEGETIHITPHPDPGYYPNTIKSNDWPPDFVNPDAYHASFTMPANDVTVYMMWNQFVVESGFYYSVGVNAQELSPEQKFREETSPLGEYVYEAVLNEGDYFSLTRVFTEQNWSYGGIRWDPDVDWTITPEMAGHVRIYLTETEREGYTKVFDYSQWTAGSSDVWMTMEHALPITVDPNIAHGSVTAPADAFKDDSVVLTVTPDAGYILDTLTVTDADGTSLELYGNSFFMPDTPVTVTATFKQAAAYTVTLVGAGDGVTITSTKQTAMEGENVDVNVITDSTHRFVSISAEDEEGNAILLTKRPDGANKYRFVMPASNVTVTVVTQEIYPLWLGSTQVSSLNYTDILGDGSASYDPATRTLSFSSAAPAFVGNYGGALINYTADDSLTIEAPNGLTLAGSDSDGTTYAIYSYGANIVVNGDLTLNFPDGNGVWLTMGTLTVNGDVDGTTKAFALYGGGGVAVDGSVNVTNQDSIRVVFSNGAVSISGDYTGVGYGIDAAGGITIGGSATITASTTANNCGLQSAGGAVSVGGDFSFSGKAQYVVSAAQGFTCAGDVTVFNNYGKGIYSASGAITVVSGTWDVTAVSEPLKAAGGITIPATHSVTEPEAGVVTLLDGFYLITEADGATLPTHVVIEPDEPPVGTVTVSFDAGEGAVDPAAMDITAGAAIGELPTPTREGGWVFMGWYMAPAATAFDICQGTKVTEETTFDANTKVYAHWRLPGDVNGDGNVDGTDVTLLATYVKAGGLNVRIVPYSGDVSGDENVDGTDVTLLATFVKANGLNVVIH